MGRACGLGTTKWPPMRRARHRGRHHPDCQPNLRTKATFRPQDQIDRAFLERVISDRQR